MELWDNPNLEKIKIMNITENENFENCIIFDMVRFQPKSFVISKIINIESKYQTLLNLSAKNLKQFPIIPLLQQNFPDQFPISHRGDFHLNTAQLSLRTSESFPNSLRKSMKSLPQSNQRRNGSMGKNESHFIPHSSWKTCSRDWHQVIITPGSGIVPELRGLVVLLPMERSNSFSRGEKGNCGSFMMNGSEF